MRHATRWTLARSALIAIAITAASIAPSIAEATPPDLFGYGARTPGLGFTGVSFVDDYEAVYTNPAGLGRVRRRALVLGLSAGAFDLTIDGERAPVTPSRGMTIGFQLPIPFGDVLQDRLVLGGGFWTPAAVLLHGEVAFPEVPQWPVLDRTQSIAIQLGLGFDFHGIVDGLTVGVGVSALANVVGDLDVRLDETNSFTSVVETQLLTTFSPLVGVMYNAPEWGVGAVYRHEVRSEMDLRIVTRDLPVVLPVVSVAGLIQYDPPTVAAEGYWRPIPDVRIALQAAVRFWSAYAGPYQPTSANSFLPPAPGFSDMFVPRISIEGTLRSGLVELQLRGGYSMELSPSPPARLAPERDAMGRPRLDMGSGVLRPIRFVDNDRHVLTAGLGLRYRYSEAGRITLDAFGQVHILADRTHDIGASEGAPPMRSGGYALAGGWTMGLEF